MVGELVDHLNLDGNLKMGQDWGGPISMAVDVARADRVRGVVPGNTWFWPAEDLPTKAFSKVMGSPPMQWAILRRNFFVERIIPGRDGDPVERRSHGALPQRATHAGGARRRGANAKEILAARAAAGEAGP